MQRRRDARSRMESRTIVCYLGGICRRLEPLERIYGRFPSVDPSGRFAGVLNLGKPQGGREGRCLQGNLWYSAPASLTSRLASVTVKMASKVFIIIITEIPLRFLGFGDFKVFFVVES